MIGYAFCGSFCTVRKSIATLKRLSENYDILPVFSPSFQSTDTRFGKAGDFMREIEEICGRRGVRTIDEAEPIGPSVRLDALVISPCTGITDTPVTMAAKAHLRNQRPLIIALATNDALSANLQNIGIMLGRKNVYFVPLGQDDPTGKPSSLVCDFGKVGDTLSLALEGRQIQPLII